MRPLVLDQFRDDLNAYGCAFWQITDTRDEFCIERIDPCKIGGLMVRY